MKSHNVLRITELTLERKPYFGDDGPGYWEARPGLVYCTLTGVVECFLDGRPVLHHELIARAEHSTSGMEAGRRAIENFVNGRFEEQRVTFCQGAVIPEGALEPRIHEVDFGMNPEFRTMFEDLFDLNQYNYYAENQKTLPPSGAAGYFNSGPSPEGNPTTLSHG